MAGFIPAISFVHRVRCDAWKILSDAGVSLRMGAGATRRARGNSEQPGWEEFMKRRFLAGAAALAFLPFLLSAASAQIAISANDGKAGIDDGKSIVKVQDPRPLPPGTVGLRQWQRPARYRNLWVKSADGARTDLSFEPAASSAVAVSGMWSPVTSGTAVLEAAGFTDAVVRIGELNRRLCILPPRDGGPLGGTVTYRCHDLFRDYVLRRVDLLPEAERNAIKLRAARALEACGFGVAGLRLYADAGDAEATLRSIQRD